MDKIINSKFKEVPKLNIVWWTFMFGLIQFLGFIVFMILVSNLGNTPAPGMFGNAGEVAISLIFLVIFEIIFFFPTFVLGIISFKKGERSWVLWLGFSPAILISIIFILFIIINISRLLL